MIANDDDDAVVLDDPDGMRAYDISANKRKDQEKNKTASSHTSKWKRRGICYKKRGSIVL